MEWEDYDLLESALSQNVVKDWLFGQDLLRCGVVASAEILYFKAWKPKCIGKLICDKSQMNLNELFSKVEFYNTSEQGIKNEQEFLLAESKVGLDLYRRELSLLECARSLAKSKCRMALVSSPLGRRIHVLSRIEMDDGSWCLVFELCEHKYRVTRVYMFDSQQKFGDVHCRPVGIVVTDAHMQLEISEISSIQSEEEIQSVISSRDEVIDVFIEAHSRSRMVRCEQRVARSPVLFESLKEKTEVWYLESSTLINAEGFVGQRQLKHNRPKVEDQWIRVERITSSDESKCSMDLEETFELANNNDDQTEQALVKATADEVSSTVLLSLQGHPASIDADGLNSSSKPSSSAGTPTDSGCTRCALCDRVFQRRRNFERHYAVVHNNIRKFRCEECSRFFGSRSNLDRHINACHLKHRPFSCDVCVRSFSQASDLARHKNRRHRDKQAISV